MKRALFFALSCSCGGAAPIAPPQEQPSTPVVEAAPEPISVVPVDSTRDERCSGADLDASVLGRAGVCSVERNSEALPESIDVSLVPESQAVEAGRSAELAIELVNRGTQIVELYLDHSCGYANVVETEVYHPRGFKLDHVGDARCRRLDCAGGVSHLSLEAGGVARIGVEVSTLVNVVNDACEALPGRPLAPGSYRVLVGGILLQSPLEANIDVVPVPRLPTERCGEYARIAAEKAEPDKGPREELRRSILKECKKKAPSLEFAECRMNAASEGTLAGCSEVPLP